jgi:hypothetical protein
MRAQHNKGLPVPSFLQCAVLALLIMGLNAQMLPVASDYRSLSAALRPIIPDIINDIKLTGAAYRGSRTLPNNSFAPTPLLLELMPALKLSDASYEGAVFPVYNITVSALWTVSSDSRLH